MSERTRNTLLYGVTVIMCGALMWALGVIHSTTFFSGACVFPLVYWLGFGDGERYGEKRW